MSAQPATPAAGFVEGAGPRLHFLDWGGAGVPLVFIPGGGQSAHVFGGIAPAFADAFRVLGLSPRAHGSSDTPSDGYTIRSFADDLGRALDSWGAERAVLVAHSVAGVVATRLAAERPDRVAAIIYLDAVLDYGALSRVQARNPVRPPPLLPFGPDPAAAEKDWLRRFYYPRWTAELEADWRARPSHDVTRRRRVLLAQYADDASRAPPSYASVWMPALALVSAETAETFYPWLDPDDESRRQRAAKYLRAVRGPWRDAEIARFVRAAPQARVVSFPAHHFAFLFDRDRVIREMRAFLSGLTTDAGRPCGGSMPGKRTLR